jgi:lipopolysaccharide/colanic/teichoic acid biosynthesis glycosyltransferase
MAQRYSIAYIPSPAELNELFLPRIETGFDVFFSDNIFILHESVSKGKEIKAVFMYSAPDGINELFFQKIQKSVFPVILLCRKINAKLREEALKAGFDEIFDEKSSAEDILIRTTFLIENPVIKDKKAEAKVPVYRMPPAKRIFDILVSSISLLILSPLFLLIAIAIRLESKGPVFYYSLRVGTGYQIFRFYKFRSMYSGADKKLKDLSHLNQYAGGKKPDGEHTEQESLSGKKENLLYMDGKAISEEEYRKKKKEKEGAAFVKIKDDPRVTKVGKFIRNTSIDELPQLYNVLIGNMSIVGNRPLPLYEAEKITTDRFSPRFMAPAGITGLWQVTRRGLRGEMSEEERMELDNDYARNYSFWRDILLILRTVPALFQKENV